MSSIYMASGQLNWHRNAMEYFLSLMNHEICDVSPGTPQLFVQLYTNDYVPVCDSQLDDFDQADFTGYNRIQVDVGECAGVFQFGRDAANLPNLFMDMQTFTQTGTTITNLVYGMIIRSTYSGFSDSRDDAIASMRFTNGTFSIDAAANIINITAFGTLDAWVDSGRNGLRSGPSTPFGRWSGPIIKSKITRTSARGRSAAPCHTTGE